MSLKNTQNTAKTAKLMMMMCADTQKKRNNNNNKNEGGGKVNFFSTVVGLGNRVQPSCP